MRLIALAVATLLSAAAPVSAEEPPPVEEQPAPEPREVHAIVFPVAGPHRYTDTWGAPRGGARRHEGTDIMADKMVPVVAAAAGTVGWIHDERGGNCCAMALEHDDGWSSWYIHLNNDTPGTDDGQGWGFAEGIELGVHVEAGQLIGYVGDSGNAEWTGSHLHFELHRPDGTKINPFPSLEAATVVAAPEDPEASHAPWACKEGTVCDGVAMVGAQARFELFRSITAQEPHRVFLYGNPGDVPLLGDWDCDGVRTPAMYRPTNGFMYLRNANTEGFADVEYFYGDPSDIPLAGDFNGDGCDTLSIYRADEGRVYVKNSLGTGVADFDYFFGDPGDKPFVGDFDGDGVDTVGLHRESTGFVYFRNAHAAGRADFEFFYGDPGDRILAGDWDGNGTDTVAIYRPTDANVYYRMSNSAGFADHTQPVGDYAAVLLATGAPGEAPPEEPPPEDPPPEEPPPEEPPPEEPPPEEPPPEEPEPVLAAAGDIADCDAGAEATATLLDELFGSGATGVVAPLGDLAYPDGTAEQFADCYDPSWGRHREITRPAPGNHEYHTPGAAGYYEYFGAAAGNPAEGWYSYELGSWHVVALNSNCDEIGGCGEGSPQLDWLRADLAASEAVCTVAYSHSPRFSSGPHGDDEDMAELWAELDAAGVELLLSGHDHIYERFAPRDAAGEADEQGVRQFVAGLGGRSLYDIETTSPHTEASYNDSFGILVLSLSEGHYHWEFRPAAGFDYEDTGTGTCN